MGTVKLNSSSTPKLKPNNNFFSATAESNKIVSKELDSNTNCSGTHQESQLSNIRRKDENVNNIKNFNELILSKQPNNIVVN